GWITSLMKKSALRVSTQFVLREQQERKDFCKHISLYQGAKVFMRGRVHQYATEQKQFSNAG
ncbi:hypothetical protein, partial [Legionella sp. W05-934-2]|uniref:hypothetical protein n=1 Tax=Legionella sp. W05-934-2 TaxID=1198649 RepID=UPI003463661D